MAENIVPEDGLGIGEALQRAGNYLILGSIIAAGTVILAAGSKDRENEQKALVDKLLADGVIKSAAEANEHLASIEEAQQHDEDRAGWEGPQ